MRKRNEDFYLGTLLCDRGSVTLARFLGVSIDRLDSQGQDYDARFTAPAGGWPQGVKLPNSFLPDFKGAYLSGAPFELGNKYDDGSFKKTWGLTSNADYIGVVFYDEHDPTTGKGSLALVNLLEWRDMWLGAGHEECHTGHVCPENSPCRWPIYPPRYKQKAGDGTRYWTWCAYPSLSDLGRAVRLQIDYLVPVTYAPVPLSLLRADRVSSRNFEGRLSPSVFVILIEDLASERDELLSPATKKPVAYFSSTLVSSTRVNNLSHVGSLLFYMSIMVAHLEDGTGNPYDGTVPANREKFNEHVHVQLQFSPEGWKQAAKELVEAELIRPYKDGFAVRNWHVYQKQRRPPEAYRPAESIVKFT
jgi:hypothetical protein